MNKIIFDPEFYSDLPPEDKSEEELSMLVMRTAAGEALVIRKYNEQEIHRCARKLIEQGIIRGTVLGSDHCSWSRLTMKGRMFMNLKKKYSNAESQPVFSI